MVVLHTTCTGSIAGLHDLCTLVICLFKGSMVLPAGRVKALCRRQLQDPAGAAGSIQQTLQPPRCLLQAYQQFAAVNHHLKLIKRPPAWLLLLFTTVQACKEAAYGLTSMTLPGALLYASIAKHLLVKIVAHR